MKPIYEPKGKAKEYGDYAINIYTGCPHRCYYCFAPGVLHKAREQFHDKVFPRVGIVEATKKQLERERIAGKLIHLCFTCDPYPAGVDTTPTREIIKLLKEHGNHVQILTKGVGERDFDLLDSGDWYGVTYAGYDSFPCSYMMPPKEEPGATPTLFRLTALQRAHNAGIKTWASLEPILDANDALDFLSITECVDRYKIGKLNYHPSTINWAEFGRQAEEICKRRGLDYMIKDGLRKEMEASHE